MEFVPRRSLMRRALQVGASLAFLFASVHAASGEDGRRDPGFRPIFRSPAEIRFAVPQPDGSVLVGGSFTRFLGAERRSLARIRPDGTPDPDFAPQGGRNIWQAFRQSDGRVVCVDRSVYPSRLYRLTATGQPDPTYVGPAGSIDTYYSGGLIADAGNDRLFALREPNFGEQRVVRLLADGREDPAFIINGASEGAIYGVRPTPAGGAFVWGRFQFFAGQVTPRLVRLLADGTLDESFHPDLSLSLSDEVSDVRPTADGGALVMVFGSSAVVSSTSSVRLVRLNASGAQSSNFAISGDSNTYFASWLERAGGTRLVRVSNSPAPASGAVRVDDLRPDGTVERTVVAPGMPGRWLTIFGIGPDGTIIFLDRLWSSESEDFHPRQDRLMRLVAGATTATALGDSPGEVEGATINGLASAPDGRVLAWGGFHAVDGASTPNGAVVRRADGTWDAAAVTGLSAWRGAIRDAVPVPAGGWLLFGALTDVAGTAVPYLRLDASGQIDPAWLSAARSGPLGGVTAAVADPNGGLLLLGGQKVARLRSDGTYDPAFQVVAVNSVMLFASGLAVLPDGRFYLGVRQSPNSSGTSGGSIVRRLADGRADPTFSNGANSSHISFAPRLDGGVTLLDAVSTIDASTELPTTLRARMKRLRADGSLDPGFAPRSRVLGTTRNVRALRDGRILLDGDFQAFGERSRAGLVRLTADGELDTTFRPELPVGRAVTNGDNSNPVNGATYDTAGATGAQAFAELPDGSLLVAPRAGSDPMVRLLVDPQPAVAGRGRGQLVNVSSRGRVEAGDGAMIAGFVVSGGTKRVIVRALGPSLAAAGVAGTLADPSLGIFAGGTLLAANDDWQTSASAGDIAAVGLAPSSAQESAVAVTLASGAYTAVVRGAAGGRGVALVEVYVLDVPDYSSPPPAVGVPRAANLSTRASVGTGDDVLIGGFTIRGGSARVALRGLGPTLAGAGVSGTLADPFVRVVRQADGYTVFKGDSWRSQSSGVGDTRPLVLPTPTDAEVATVLDLPEGDYTVIVSGVNSGTGIGMFEVYELPDNGAP